MKRIKDLDETGSVDLDGFLGVDKAGWSEALKLKLQTLYNYIATQFGAADTAIKTGAGLNTNGTLTPPSGAAYVTSAAFTAAALDVNLKNGLKLLDAKCYALANAIGGATQTTFVVKKINHNSQRLLNSNPITLIGNPGADKTINIIGCVAWLDYAGGALNCGSSTLDIRYTGNASVICSFSNAFLESGVDAFQKAVPATQTPMFASDSVQVYCGSNDTGGTSTSDIYIAIFYNVITWLAWEVVTEGGLPDNPA